MASRGGFLVGDGALRRKNNGKKTNSAAIKHNKPLTRKKRKPVWDDTVNDLNVHKATQEELIKRHEAHKSKNVGLVQNMANKENQSLLDTPDSTVKRKQAILQEILFGQDKFQEVLAETDRTMSAVRDIFGDDPKKFLGFPNVTVAPNKNEDISDSRLFMTGPFADVPETPTHLSMLSDSVMNTPALNELSDDDAASESSDAGTSPNDKQAAPPAGSAFEPKLDLQRYRQFISHESGTEESHKTTIPEHVQRINESYTGVINNGNKTTTTSKVAPSNVVTQQSDTTNSTGVSNLYPRSTENVPHQTSAVPTPVNQIPTNDRQNDKPAKAGVSKKGKPKHSAKSVDTSTSSSNSGLRSLEDLRKMVESLEDEIAEYEMETGRQPIATTLQTGNFSGYTSSLITAVTKLMKYLKETETQRRAEAVLRDQILQGFAEQRTLIDALTNDIVQTQEQYVALQSQFYGYKQNTDQHLSQLQRDMYTVLKSYEYHTIQSTINTLHSTKPIPMDTQPSSQDYSITTSGRVGHIKGDYIPVSATCQEPTEHSNDMGIAGPYITMARPEQSREMISTQVPLSTGPVVQPHHTATHLLSTGPVQPHHTATHLSSTGPVQPHHTATHLLSTGPVQPHHTATHLSSTGPVQPHHTATHLLSTGPVQPHHTATHLLSTGPVQQHHTTTQLSSTEPVQPQTAIHTHTYTTEHLPHHATYPIQHDQRFTISAPIQQDMQQTGGIHATGDSSTTINHAMQTRIPQPGTQYQDMEPHYNGSGGENQQTLLHTLSSLGPKQNGVHVDYSTVEAHVPLVQPWKGNSLDATTIPKPSHQHPWDEEGSVHHLIGDVEGVLSEGVQDTVGMSAIGHGTRDDSILVKSFIKGPQATRQLRHRLHGIAMKQKNNVALKTSVEQGIGQANDKTSNGQPSPHVHFKFPQQGTYGQGLSHKALSSLPEKSPSVSPIAEEVLDVPIVKTSGLKKGRQVVVNLPSVWSDVSSTVSL